MGFKGVVIVQGRGGGAFNYIAVQMPRQIFQTTTKCVLIQLSNLYPIKVFLNTLFKFLPKIELN